MNDHPRPELVHRPLERPTTSASLRPTEPLDRVAATDDLGELTSAQRRRIQALVTHAAGQSANRHDRSTGTRDAAGQLRPLMSDPGMWIALVMLVLVAVVAIVAIVAVLAFAAAA